MLVFEVRGHKGHYASLAVLRWGGGYPGGSCVGGQEISNVQHLSHDCLPGVECAVFVWVCCLLSEVMESCAKC